MAKQPPQIRPPHFLNMREVFLQAAEELAKPYPSTSIPAWPLWNKFTGGLRANEYSILCGSTGAGKTTWLANLSAHLLRQNVKHFVASVETGHTDFMKRVLSCLEGKDLNTGEPVPVEELTKICTRQMRYLERDTIELSLYDNRIPLEQLIADLEYMSREKKCQIAMLDNLNFFMEVTRAHDQLVEMDRVTHELIMLCKRIPIHIIMVMHPKKTGDGTRVESEYDVKGSSTAVQEAQNVLLFNRPKPKDIEEGDRDAFDRELKIAKMRRRGMYVGKTIVYRSIGTQYEELSFK